MTRHAFETREAADSFAEEHGSTVEPVGTAYVVDDGVEEAVPEPPAEIASEEDSPKASDDGSVDGSVDEAGVTADSTAEEFPEVWNGEERRVNVVDRRRGYDL